MFLFLLLLLSLSSSSFSFCLSFWYFRILLLRSDDEKSPGDRLEEKNLLKEIVEVVEKRNHVVELVEQDRRREEAEDQSIKVRARYVQSKEDGWDGRTKSESESRRDGRRNKASYGETDKDGLISAE